MKDAPMSKTTNKIDVTALGSESLATGKFPASSRSDFRLFFAPSAHQQISQHAHQDSSVEICGVLVGEWRQDENGPFGVVENIIRCDNAASKFAEVTFTHESWAKINEEMDSNFDDKRIVGWYHSHPDFGIFLSDRDCFIHEHFFSNPGQVAFVVDPVRELEGVFAWKDGKPAAMRHYWVGDTVLTVQASTANPAAEERKRADDATSRNAVATYGRVSAGDVPLLTLALCALAALLFGFAISGWQREWERQAIVDGVVSNYTNFKMAKIGLDQELLRVQSRLDSITQAVESMPAVNEELTKEKAGEANKLRKLIVANLLDSQLSLAAISQRYSLSEYELRALAKLQQEMRAAVKAAVPPDNSKSPPKQATPDTVQPAKPEESAPVEKLTPMAEDANARQAAPASADKEEPRD
jgi:proteasome lid subunit RPN8/RPN11